MNGYDENPFSSGSDYARGEQKGGDRQKVGARETAWRMFSSEFNGSKLEIKAMEEKMPSYVVTPLGAKVNRILIAGVLTEKENRGTEEEPMWTCRVQDPAGNFYVNAGRFQPEASAALSSLPSPCMVAAVGKVRTFHREDGSMSVSVRPERVMEIDDAAYRGWILEAAKSTWTRLKNMKRACMTPDSTKESLMAMGVSPAEAEGITYVLDNDAMPDSAVYLKAIQNALRKLLPDEEIDFGFPDEFGDDMPRSAPAAPSSGGSGKADWEDAVLRLLEELDVDGKGAPRDELERRAESMGISSVDLEEISNSLMDKGLVYEPNLRYLKRI